MPEFSVRTEELAAAARAVSAQATQVPTYLASGSCADTGDPTVDDILDTVRSRFATMASGLGSFGEGFATSLEAVAVNYALTEESVTP